MHDRYEEAQGILLSLHNGKEAAELLGLGPKAELPQARHPRIWLDKHVQLFRNPSHRQLRTHDIFRPWIRHSRPDNPSL